MVDTPSPAGEPTEGGGTRVILLLRVWLADRPGALGQVASRIGALRGDIIGVDVLERRPDVVVDEFAIALPDADNVDLLVREVEEVDGATVDDWRLVDHVVDARLDALVSAGRLCRCTTRESVLATLVRDVADELRADWVAVLDDGGLLEGVGRLPDLDCLADRRHCPPGDEHVTTPFPAVGATLVAARSGHPIRRRERDQLAALAAIADRVLELLA